MPRKPDMPCAKCGTLMWRGTGVLPEGRATCRECRSRRPGYGQGKPVTSITVWDCLACGRRCERKPTKGQRPKWCEDCRQRGVKKQIDCAHCGVTCWTWQQGKFCSLSCRSKFHAPPPKPKVQRPKYDPRGELRRAYEDGDSELFFAAIVARADTSSGDCWTWPTLKDGYPTVRLGKNKVPLHRAVLEVKHGAPLGSQAAHHICANAGCVNPDHLQPVTHRENVAEMLARHSYLARIRELEAALAAADPSHPLLSILAIA